MADFTPATAKTPTPFGTPASVPAAKTFGAKVATTAQVFGGIDPVLRDELLGALLDDSGYELFDQNQR